MPNKPISADTKGFREKLFDTIQQGGPQKLLAIFEKAEQRYLNTSWRKGRTTDFDLVKKQIRAMDTVDIKVIGNFTRPGEGGWSSNSANTYLMLELINASGHERTPEETDEKLCGKPLMDLSQHFNEDIVTDVVHRTNVQKANAQEKKQREQKLEKKIQSLPNALLAASYEEGQALKAAHPEKFVYVLSVDNAPGAPSRWSLTWIDDLGNPAWLPVSDNFQALLSNLKDGQLPEPDSDLQDKIKHWCKRLHPSHANISLFDNSQSAIDFARRFPNKHSFCLTATAPSAACSSSSAADITWQLAWYDRQGRARPVLASEKLEQLLQALQQFPASDTKENYDIKNQCLSLVRNLLANIKVGSKPAPASYVLKGNELTWYNSMGDEQDIPFGSCPELSAWLAARDPAATKITDSDLQQLKTLLRHLIIRREVDPDNRALIHELMINRKNMKVPLIPSNSSSLDGIPRYRLIPDTYFLFRENKAWLLCQLTGFTEGKPDFKRMETWEKFYDLLANHDVLPQDLPPATLTALDDCIKLYEAREKKKPINCFVVGVLPTVEGQWIQAPGSFLINKSDDQWSVHYVDILQRLIPVPWQNMPRVAEQIVAWAAEPTRDELSTLDRSLAGYKPETKLKASDYEAAKKILDTRVGSSNSLKEGVHARAYARMAAFFQDRPNPPAAAVLPEIPTLLDTASLCQTPGR